MHRSFAIEDDFGRARVVQQGVDSDEKLQVGLLLQAPVTTCSLSSPLLFPCFMRHVSCGLGIEAVSRRWQSDTHSHILHITATYLGCIGMLCCAVLWSAGGD